MTVDVLVEDQRWRATGIDKLGPDAVAATLSHLGYRSAALEVAILACDDTRIAELNAGFRALSAPTNVLSWPSEERAVETDGERPEPPSFPELGDIAIAFETCEREAADQGKSLRDHTVHLLVHGTLHLLGYDHIRPKDAEMMEALEVEILARMGIADPY